MSAGESRVGCFEVTSSFTYGFNVSSIPAALLNRNFLLSWGVSIEAALLLTWNGCISGKNWLYSNFSRLFNTLS